MRDRTWRELCKLTQLMLRGVMVFSSTFVRRRRGAAPSTPPAMSGGSSAHTPAVLSSWLKVCSNSSGPKLVRLELVTNATESKKPCCSSYTHSSTGGLPPQSLAFVSLHCCFFITCEDSNVESVTFVNLVARYACHRSIWTARFSLTRSVSAPCAF